MTKSRQLNAKRYKWNHWQDAIILATYGCTSNHALIKILGCTLQQLYTRAQVLGIKKSDWFWKNHPTNGSVRQMPDALKSVGRFYQGQIPHNKGRKGWCMPGCEVGWFQKGHKPINILPIGHIRKTKDGYFEIKINTTGYKPNDWVAIHRLVYERMTNKPIPPNHVIIFLDGNQENYDPTNLKCITKKENMIRNSMHQYGPVYVKLKQLEGAITRQINLKEKQHEHSTNAL